MDANAGLAEIGGNTWQIRYVAHASITGALAQTDGYVSVKSQSMRDMIPTMMTHVMSGEIKMNTINNEITEARYKELEAMSYSEQHSALFPNGVPDSWEYGYGYYGHSIFERNGKYYVQFKIGNSCE